MSKASKARRAAPEYRAGTRIALYPAHGVYYENQKGERVCHGYVDRAARVYQGGGERAEIINTRREPPVISCMASVWHEVLQRAQGHGRPEEWHWEMIEHASNECYRISFLDALDAGGYYETAAGVRFGVPVSRFALLKGPTAPKKGGPAQRRLVFGEANPADYRK